MTGVQTCALPICLSATASKNDIELIAVVMHAPNGKERVADCISLLNYGYGIVSRYEDVNPPEIPEIRVKGGTEQYVSCSYRNNFSYIFLKNYDASKISCHFEILNNIEAPVGIGDSLGMLVYEYDGNTIGGVDIIASQDIKKAGYNDYIRQLLNNFF